MKTIAVIFGGRSTEHDISILTALKSVIKPLELTGKYNVEAVYISKKGNWYWDDRLKNISLFTSGDIENFISKAAAVQMSFNDGFTLHKSTQFAGRKLSKKIDVVFPAMHGTYGEDGDLMGLLEMANVAYVGCGVAASVIAMDKVLSKQVTGAAGIASTPWCWFDSSQLTTDPAGIIKATEKLAYPLFVKPVHLGSSIGITKVEEPKQLMNALEVAAHYDNKIIVEQAVQNLIEVTLPIIGNTDLTPALLERPLTQSDDFFNFDTKYLNSGKKGGKSGAKTGSQGYSQLPAELEPKLYDKAQALALNVYRAINCEGIARVDMLIDKLSGEVYFNEVNPLPGGLYDHNWQASGVSSIQLVTKLVDLALQRHESQQKHSTTFSTNFLKQF